MHKKILQRVCLFVLLAAALFVSGCTQKPTDTEIYISEFVLHDINDTTKTLLQAPAEQYGEYNFAYNMPGNSPEEYSSIWFFFSPGQSITASSIYPVASGSKQTLYAYESNPVPENYKLNLSLSREINLNYFKADNYFEQSAYQDLRKEYFSGENKIYANYINLKSNEQKEYLFGGSYTPGSITINEYGNINLRGNILSGINTYASINTNISICNKTEMSGMWIICKQWIGRQIDAPYFGIYENGEKVKEGNLTYNDGRNVFWATWPMYYYTRENKNYLVNMTIPSYTPTFSKSIVTASFSTEEKDRAPPWLTELKADAGFEENAFLEVSFNATDDKDLTSIRVFSRSDGSQWEEVQENLAPPANTGAKPVKVTANIPTRGNAIDLRIELKDNTGNSQIYTILPISLNKRGHELKIEVQKDKDIVSPGTLVKFSGKISDLTGKGISNLFISAYYNGKEVAKAYTQKGFWDFGEDIEQEQFYVDRNGNFSFLFNVPLDYTIDANLSIITKETGVYQQKEHIISGFAQIFDKDAAVLGITTPAYLTIGENEINVTIANVGKTEADAQLKIWQSDIDGERNEIGERTLLKSVVVSLQPQETKTISLNVRPQLTGDINQVQKIIASAVIEGDKNNANDEQSVLRLIFAQTDASVIINAEYKWIVNESKPINITIINGGITDLRDVNYTLKIIERENSASSTNDKNAVPESSEIIASGKIESLKSREKVVKSINLNFSSLGRHKVQAQIQAGGDLNSNNDVQNTNINVIKRGADISSDFWRSSGNPILNQEMNITVSVINEGTETARDVNFSLYAAKGNCNIKNTPLSSCEDVKLIYSNYSAELRADARIENIVKFTPS
ncbi:MAG: hypothetical protein AABX07_03130, partial [Nanoarchaeota archaeon]